MDRLEKAVTTALLAMLGLIALAALYAMTNLPYADVVRAGWAGR